MAGAAVSAFRLWRAQVKGQTEHDLAKRLSNAIYQLRKARERAVQDLRILEAVPHTHRAALGDLRLDQVGDEPCMVVEVEYAMAEGFFGAPLRSPVRRLNEDEQSQVARRIATVTRLKDQQPFRP